MNLHFILTLLIQSKCSSCCNNINSPYAKLCVRDVFKNINLGVFNLMSRSNETIYIKFHKTCKCKCRLNASVCNNKQRLNENKCRCERKELINKSSCDKEFIWNPSNCECECDKLCGIGEYLDYIREYLFTLKMSMKKKFIQQNCILKKQLLLYAVLAQFTSYFFIYFLQ